MPIPPTKPQPTPAPPSTRPTLTPREIQVSSYLGEDLEPKHIAQSLGLSPNTVRIHIRNIYQKLGVRSRHAAVARLYQLRLISIPPSNA